jgi:hypothetical protein
MSNDSDLQRARRDLSFAFERNTSLAAPFVDVFPVTGAAVSVLSTRIGQNTVASTDATASRLDELQFDLGEGPCWEALAGRTAILEPDVKKGTSPRYPEFTHAMQSDPIGGSVSAMFAFPLVVGTLGIGAVDMWVEKSQSLTPEQVSAATALADIAARQVLRKVLADVPELVSSADSILSRREIHQATGMILVQLNVTAEDAALLLRAHAFATNRTLGEVANDVVERRLDFTTDPPASIINKGEVDE